MPVEPELPESVLVDARSQAGESLADLTGSRPRLLVFLRHLGCPFCRETLADLARKREAIEGAGAGIVLVHLARDDQRAARLFTIYRLADVPRFSDPGRALYRAVGLGHGGAAQLLGPRVLARTAIAGCRGLLPGSSEGDTRQMPGVFLIHGSRILRAFRHRTIADRPDYEALSRAPTSAERA